MSNLIRVELDEVSKAKIENLENMISRVTLLLESPAIEGERFLDKNEVQKMVCFSESYLKEKIKEGLFPPPIKVFTRNRWRYSDIQEWISQQKIQ